MVKNTSEADFDAYGDKSIRKFSQAFEMDLNIDKPSWARIVLTPSTLED